jgi:hypothetical protein
LFGVILSRALGKIAFWKARFTSHTPKLGLLFEESTRAVYRTETDRNWRCERYQYLSLVHFLHTGQFSPEAGTGFLLNNTKMENIRDAAHRIFGSYEYTDIDRDKLFRENRDYHDKERNISIFYYLYWGDMWTTHGTSIPDPTLVGARKSYNWTYVGILHLLANIKMHFYPLPTTLILNA